MENGPTSSINLNEVQDAIIRHFDEIVEMQPGAVGTCKKMVRLDCLNPEWAHLAVVYAKQSNEKLNAIVKKEYQLLTHLNQQGYPIVAPCHSPFMVPSKQRVAMILPFVPGAFIEAKTPLPLKLLVTAGLLGLTTPAQEGWAFHRNRIIEQIGAELTLPETLQAFQTRAKCLANEFRLLINKLNDQSLRIHDLQMLIQANGKLTIIDPLEVISISTKGAWYSLLEQELLDKPDFKKFVNESQTWLLRAEQFCHFIADSDHVDQIVEQCSQLSPAPVIFSYGADIHCKSRINQIKSAHTLTQSEEIGKSETKFKRY